MVLERGGEAPGERPERLQVPQVTHREPRVKPVHVRGHHRVHRTALLTSQDRPVRSVHRLHQVMRLVENDNRTLQIYPQTLPRLLVKQRRVRREHQVRAGQGFARGVIGARLVTRPRRREVLDVHRSGQRRFRKVSHRGVSLLEIRTPAASLRLRFAPVLALTLARALASRLWFTQFEAPLVEPRGRVPRRRPNLGVNAQLRPRRHRDRVDRPVLAAERRRVELADHLRELRVGPAAEYNLLRRGVVGVGVRVLHSESNGPARSPRAFLS